MSEPHTEILLDFCGLWAAYPEKNVFRDAKLSVRRGEICAVIGEEGSGKTTLQKALTGQIQGGQVGGEVFFKGKTLKCVPPHRLKQLGLGYVLQGGNILPTLTVGEMLELAFDTMPQKRRTEKMIEIDSVFPQISTLLNRQGGKLSGGERMIVSLATLAATEADFFILDEPTAGLAEEVCQTIAKYLQSRRDIGILLIEHNYDFAFQLSHQVVTLLDGKLSEKYEPDAFHAPGFVNQHLYQLNTSNI